MDLSESGDAARKYWHEVLTAGGRTVVPRWSADPAKGSPPTKWLYQSGC